MAFKFSKIVLSSSLIIFLAFCNTKNEGKVTSKKELIKSYKRLINNKVKQDSVILILDTLINFYDVDMYNERGLIYQKLKQYKLAINDFSKAIEKNPGSLLNRASTYALLGKLDSAISDVQLLYQNNNNDSDYLYLHMGLMCQLSKKTDRAIRYLDTSVYYSKNDFYPNLMRARLYIQDKDTVLACSDLKVVQRLSKNADLKSEASLLFKKLNCSSYE